MTCIVYCTAPLNASKQLAKQLVEKKLIACCNISKVDSFYLWDGKLQEEEEGLMMMKTTIERYPELERIIMEEHPYDTPEIIKVPITGQLDYIKWIKSIVDE